MLFEQELAICLRSRFGLIIVVSLEEERLLDAVRTACQRIASRGFTWDVGDGFTDLDKFSPGGGAQSDSKLPRAMDPRTALEAIDAYEGPGLFVLKDFHDCWTNAPVKRKLRSVVQRLKYTQKNILVITPTTRIPEELRDEVEFLDFPAPGEETLRRVLEPLMKTPGLRDNLTEEGRGKLVEAAVGLTTAQAQRVFSRAIVSNGTLDNSDIELVHGVKRQIIRDSEALEFCTNTELPEHVGGLDLLKNWLRLRERAFTHAAREYGLPVPKGIALIGIPGTGKSLTAKMVANLWNVPLLRLDIGALFGSLVGESEERTRRALRLVESVAPCVIWIDEIENALTRGGLDSGTSNRVFGTILTWMQEKTSPSFVIATANDIAALPPELLRKGRFDDVFFLDLPTLHERRQIVAVHICRRGRIPENYDVERLARESEGYVGAEIEQAVIEAMYAAFYEGREFTTEDISDALSKLVPLSVSQRERVEILRNWLAEGRAQSASLPEESPEPRPFSPRIV